MRLDFTLIGSLPADDKRDIVEFIEGLKVYAGDLHEVKPASRFRLAATITKADGESHTIHDLVYRDGDFIVSEA